MTKEAQEARRQYRKQWSKNNPDKVRAYNQKYWEKKAREAAAAAQASGNDPEELDSSQTETKPEELTEDQNAEERANDQLRELVARKKASANFKGV